MASSVALKLFLAACLAAPLSAFACDCRSGTLKERIASSPVVVVATVVEFVPLQRVTLQANEVFKGRVQKTFTVPAGYSDCDFFLPPLEPKPGQAFLLYLGRLDGRVFASRCQNSGLAAQRTEELAELRRSLGRPQRPAVGTLP